MSGARQAGRSGLQPPEGREGGVQSTAQAGRPGRAPGRTARGVSGERRGRPRRPWRRCGVLDRDTVPGVRGDARGRGRAGSGRAVLAVRSRALSERRGGEASVGVEQLPADPGSLLRDEEAYEVRDGVGAAEATSRSLRGTGSADLLVHPVSIGPGLMTLVRTSRSASSWVPASTRRSSAPFVAP